MTPEKSWELIVTVELFVDEKPVLTERERRGAFIQHVPYDRRTLREAAGGMTRRLVNQIVRKTT